MNGRTMGITYHPEYKCKNKFVHIKRKKCKHKFVHIKRKGLFREVIEIYCEKCGWRR